MPHLDMVKPSVCYVTYEPLNSQQCGPLYHPTAFAAGKIAFHSGGQCALHDAPVILLQAFIVSLAKAPYRYA